MCYFWLVGRSINRSIWSQTSCEDKSPSQSPENRTPPPHLHKGRLEKQLIGRGACLCVQNSDQQTICVCFYKACSLRPYLVQWRPVCFSPPGWAAALCEWRAEGPASRCRIAGRWTAAGRSSDTPGWPRSSPSPGYVLDDALHSSATREAGRTYQLRWMIKAWALT